MAEHRHKRDTDARRPFGTLSTTTMVRAALAALVTTTVIAVGVLNAPVSHDLLAAQVATGRPAATMSATASADASDRFVVSRSASRKQTAEQKRKAVREARAAAALAATAKAVSHAHTRLWTTAPLNLWTSSSGSAVRVGLVAASRKVLVTGRRAGERAEIVVGGKSRWVTDAYLSEHKPVETPADPGLSMAPCPDPSVENGLTSSAVSVYRSVCHAFPQITTYGGWDAHGEHASGRAIDIMTSDVALGTAIAEFLQAHASELHVYDILWRQRIWTPVRAAEGWRTFPSRGSATADHYDHVHVSVY